MRLKKLSISMRFLIVAFAAILVAMSIFGVSDIFAEQMSVKETAEVDGKTVYRYELPDDELPKIQDTPSLPLHIGETGAYVGHEWGDGVKGKSKEANGRRVFYVPVKSKTKGFSYDDPVLTVYFENVMTDGDKQVNATVTVDSLDVSKPYASHADADGYISFMTLTSKTMWVGMDIDWEYGLIYACDNIQVSIAFTYADTGEPIEDVEMYQVLRDIDIARKPASYSEAWEGISGYAGDMFTFESCLLDVDLAATKVTGTQKANSSSDVAYVQSGAIISIDEATITQKFTESYCATGMYIYAAKNPYEPETNTLLLTKTDSETGQVVSGATYGIYTDSACRDLVETIETKKKPIESSRLTVGTTYYIKEIYAPDGYTINDEVYSITMPGGEPIDFTVEDTRQKLKFTLTVIDETTKGFANPHPLSDIEFTLHNETGNQLAKYKTNDNGQLADEEGNTTILIDAIGPCYLRQVNTQENYVMTKTNDCNKIWLASSPTKNGQNTTIIKDYIHYESRQNVVIKSHVQDANMLDRTPYEVSGSTQSNSYISSVGAQYQLVVDCEKVLLGYEDDGDEVWAYKDEPLALRTRDSDGDIVYSDVAESYRDGKKAYILAEGVRKNDQDFDLPNGEYVWKMVGASKGYFTDTTATTSISAKWEESNNTIKTLDFSSGYPVQQERQTAALVVYVKSYDWENRVVGDDIDWGLSTNTIRNRTYTSILSKRDAMKDNATNKETWMKYVDNGLKKIVKTSGNDLSSTTQEVAELLSYNEDSESWEIEYTVKAYDEVENAVYELINLEAIVDIDSGEIIPAGTVLGRYLSDENGMIEISTLGSDGFVNPNEETNSSIPKFNSVTPVTTKGREATGALPNGIYGLSKVVAADGYNVEKGLSEDVINKDLLWCAGTSNDEELNAQAVLLLYDSDSDNPAPDQMQEVPIAPDVPDDEPENPNDSGDDNQYDPNHPEDPKDPDDSNDIPITNKKWIDGSRYNVSYRVIDSYNVIGEAPDYIYDVSDEIPATFAFYVKNNVIEEEDAVWSYYLSFYYEISRADYLASSQEDRLSREYVQVEDGKYARRFSTSALSGGDSLQDVIVLNEKSPAFMGYGEIGADVSDIDMTLSGAVYNTEWLNHKLATEEDGDFNIYVFVDMEVVYTTKMDDREITVTYEERPHGTIRFKNRQLVNLN